MSDAKAINGDRQHVHPLALAVLDRLANTQDANTTKPDGIDARTFDLQYIRPYIEGCSDWKHKDRPLLTARASRVLAAVEEAMDNDVCRDCGAAHCVACPQADVPWSAIRKAWKENDDA